jgi:electron transport complex protein RnfC
MGWTQRVRRRFFTKGGIHPPTLKQTAAMKIFPGPVTEFVYIPLLQHVGEPCEPVVEPGQEVLMGQKIGDSDAYISAPVHSSVSGVVKEILRYPHPVDRGVMAVKIENNRLDSPAADLVTSPDPLELSPGEVRKRVREAGIVGLGGAAFPTHVKLDPPSGRPIELVILNGSECEPYLTGDYRLMLEKAEQIIKGGLIIRNTVGAKTVLVGIEHNSSEAIRAMREAGEQYDVDVVMLPCRYPTGAEKTLIRAVTGQEVPCGGLPLDVGVMVNNVGTCAQIYDSLTTGMPLIERVLTVAGDGVAGRANLRVRIGTRVGDTIDYCGGMVGRKGKVILGGPMMGVSQYTTDVPVIKSTTGIIVLKGERLFTDEASHFACIRCGRCVRRCPQHLMPYLMGAYADADLWDQLESCNIEDCVECGSCAYICPTKNPLVQLIKVGKGGLQRRKDKMESLSELNGKAGDENEDEDESEEELISG